nr:hypothetical protein [Nostoc sp. NZL]
MPFSPGVVPTPGYNFMGLSDEQVQEFVASQADTIPLGVWAHPTKLLRRLFSLPPMTAAL